MYTYGLHHISVYYSILAYISIFKRGLLEGLISEGGVSNKTTEADVQAWNPTLDLAEGVTVIVWMEVLVCSAHETYWGWENFPHQLVDGNHPSISPL